GQTKDGQDVRFFLLRTAGAAEGLRPQHGFPKDLRFMRFKVSTIEYRSSRSGIEMKGERVVLRYERHDRVQAVQGKVMEIAMAGMKGDDHSTAGINLYFPQLGDHR